VDVEFGIEADTNNTKGCSFTWDVPGGEWPQDVGNVVTLPENFAEGAQIRAYQSAVNANFSSSDAGAFTTGLAEYMKSSDHRAELVQALITAENRDQHWDSSNVLEQSLEAAEFLERRLANTSCMLELVRTVFKKLTTYLCGVEGSPSGQPQLVVMFMLMLRTNRFTESKIEDSKIDFTTFARSLRVECELLGRWMQFYAAKPRYEGSKPFVVVSHWETFMRVLRGVCDLDAVPTQAQAAVPEGQAFREPAEEKGGDQPLDALRGTIRWQPEESRWQPRLLLKDFIQQQDLETLMLVSKHCAATMRSPSTMESIYVVSVLRKAILEYLYEDNQYTLHLVNSTFATQPKFVTKPKFATNRTFQTLDAMPERKEWLQDGTNAEVLDKRYGAWAREHAGQAWRHLVVCGPRGLKQVKHYSKLLSLELRIEHYNHHIMPIPKLAENILEVHLRLGSFDGNLETWLKQLQQQLPSLLTLTVQFCDTFWPMELSDSDVLRALAPLQSLDKLVFLDYPGSLGGDLRKNIREKLPSLTDLFFEKAERGRRT
jgi:hypothetical protein